MIFYSDFLDSEDHLKSGSFCHFSVNDHYKFAKDGVHLNKKEVGFPLNISCLLYTSPSPRDYAASRMPSSA